MTGDKKSIIDGIELAIFRVNEMLCATDTQFVQEINQVTTVTAVHRAPDYVRGVINLRGEIVTVIDLRVKFDLPPIDLTEDSMIIVVKQSDESIGLLADSIFDVVIANKEDITPPPANVGGITGTFFNGIYKMEQDLVAIVELQELLKTKTGTGT